MKNLTALIMLLLLPNASCTKKQIIKEAARYAIKEFWVERKPELYTREDYADIEDYYKAVISVFIDLHKKGYIYRGLRMINWDCEAQTALSNEEVIYREGGEVAKFYSVK